jgi:hypothetical protein
VFENKELRRGYLESKEEEVTRGWKKPHNEEIHNFYTFPYIIRLMK